MCVCLTAGNGQNLEGFGVLIRPDKDLYMKVFFLPLCVCFSNDFSSHMCLLRSKL